MVSILQHQFTQGGDTATARTHLRLFSLPKTNFDITKANDITIFNLPRLAICYAAVMEQAITALPHDELA